MRTFKNLKIGKVCVWLRLFWKRFWKAYSKADPIGKILLFAIPCAIAIFSANFLAAWYRDNSKAGAFGDSFGVATSLFSGAAFAMLVVSIWLQRKELDIVREERDETRKILDNQQKLADKQRQALDEQTILSTSKAIEDKFFSMTELIANELHRLNDKIDHQTTHLSRAYGFVNSAVYGKPDKSWEMIKENGGTNAIYPCMPVCKLFGVAYEVAHRLEGDSQDTARNILRALADDRFIHIYGCIVKLRGAQKSQMGAAFYGLSMLDQLPKNQKNLLENALQRA